MQQIVIRGARTHNLRNVDLNLPRDKLIVVTGLSGSGKSSLAFDTVYAEGQRRYVESLSAYARQFLSVMEKPDADHIEGLSPAISIEQKSTSHNPRSTVGTITEIHDYLRLLFARAGEPRCPVHGLALRAQTVSQMVDQVLEMPESTRLMLLAPVIEARKGEHLQVIEGLRRQACIANRAAVRHRESHHRRREPLVDDAGAERAPHLPEAGDAGVRLHLDDGDGDVRDHALRVCGNAGHGNLDGGCANGCDLHDSDASSDFRP